MGPSSYGDPESPLHLLIPLKILSVLLQYDQFQEGSNFSS